MPNTRPSLPQELADAILAKVNEKDSLAECSLVCKDWVSSARRRLFESVTLRAGSLLSFDFEKNKGEDRNYEDEYPNFEDDDWDEESETDSWDEGHEPEYWGFQSMLTAFIEFAIAHTFIASNIRTFRIQGQFYTVTNFGYVYPVMGTTLRDIVAALPRLQTLSLSTLSIQDTSVTPVVEHSCLRTLVLGEEITGLDCDINNERQLKDVLQLLVIFPSLRELDFIADNFLFREHWLRPIAKSKLTSFRQRQDPGDFLDDNPPLRLTSYDFLASVIRATGNTDLHLDIDMALPESSPGFPFHVLTRVGSRLESLTLRPWWDRKEVRLEAVAWDKIKFGLSVCHSLRTLRLDFNRHFNPAMTGPLSETDLIRCIFKELFTDNCKNLSVIFHLPTLYSYTESLAELDKYAVAYVQQGFAKLNILQHDQSRVTAEEEKSIRRLMPKLSEKGILAFRE